MEEANLSRYATCSVVYELDTNCQLSRRRESVLRSVNIDDRIALNGLKTFQSLMRELRRDSTMRPSDHDISACELMFRSLKEGAMRKICAHFLPPRGINNRHKRR